MRKLKGILFMKNSPPGLFFYAFNYQQLIKEG